VELVGTGTTPALRANGGANGVRNALQDRAASPGFGGAVGLTACSTGSGEQRAGTEGSEPRKLPPSTAVDVSAQADAVVRIGEPRKVTVRGDDNLLEHVETGVSGDTLEISQDEDIDPELGITVDIRIPRLDMVELSGPET
jgi:hypothetical protein